MTHNNLSLYLIDRVLTISPSLSRRVTPLVCATVYKLTADFCLHRSVQDQLLWTISKVPKHTT